MTFGQLRQRIVGTFYRVALWSSGHGAGITLGEMVDMQLVLIGQQAFGKAVLEALLERDENVIAVYCAPDKEGARPDPLKEAAVNHKLPLLQPASYKDPEVWQVFADMNELVRARRTSPAFDHLVGSIIRVEQGEDRGFHIHAAFFFNGSERFRQFHVAERIGELWEEITKARGYWHDSAREWVKRGGNDDDRGTGMFQRSDVDGRHAVASLMTYLVKDKGQHLRIRPAGVRAYRTGCIR